MTYKKALWICIEMNNTSFYLTLSKYIKLKGTSKKKNNKDN